MAREVGTTMTPNTTSHNNYNSINNNTNLNNNNINISHHNNNSITISHHNNNIKIVESSLTPPLGCLGRPIPRDLSLGVPQ